MPTRTNSTDDHLSRIDPIGTATDRQDATFRLTPWVVVSRAVAR
jgi:hypothetical protein